MAGIIRRRLEWRTRMENPDLVLRSIAISTLLIWLLFDSLVVFRRKSRKDQDRDRKTFSVIVIGNLVAWSIGIGLAFSSFGRLHSATLLQIVGLSIMIVGIAVRAIAIRQLGRFHTPNVAILDEHLVFDDGLYAYVRHPSYLGALIAFVGFGMALGNWMSLVVIVAIMIPIYSIRIRQEEAALAEGLGDSYEAYRRRTKRLIPKIY
ncbi:MAG TPA: isoprenylcysteine carboxylmethyltransferase family protein [Candidatus Tumulicola sp.]